MSTVASRMSSLRCSAHSPDIVLYHDVDFLQSLRDRAVADAVQEARAACDGVLPTTGHTKVAHTSHTTLRTLQRVPSQWGLQVHQTHHSTSV